MKSPLLPLFLLGALAALGVAASGYFVSKTLVNAQATQNTAEAKGLAERTVPADKALWQVSLTYSTTDKAKLPELFTQMDTARARVPRDTATYALRNRIERCFAKLKCARRLATRYDKTSASYLGFIHIAAARL